MIQRPPSLRNNESDSNRAASGGFSSTETASSTFACWPAFNQPWACRNNFAWRGSWGASRSIRSRAFGSPLPTGFFPLAGATPGPTGTGLILGPPPKIPRNNRSTARDASSLAASCFLIAAFFAAAFLVAAFFTAGFLVAAFLVAAGWAEAGWFAAPRIPAATSRTRMRGYRDISETLNPGVLKQTPSIKKPSWLGPVQYSRPPRAVLPAE